MQSLFTADLGLLIMGAFSAALASLAYLAVDAPLAPRPTRGVRGLARTRALEDEVFRFLEPVLRLFATHISKLPAQKTRVAIEKQLVAAGEFRGLNPDELIVLCIASMTGGLVAALYFYTHGGGTLVPLACAGAGPFLPYCHLRSLAKERCKAIDRGLPPAIDLAALCMGAGLDFPAAIRHVVENMPLQSSPARQELERILQELSLGRTRTQALQGFARRANTDAVKEFVAAVVQAEEKGTPLAEVLAIQASALRGRRSVLAEEAAARAGVMLMLPMLMMVVSIVLLLMGPLVIEMSQKGTM